MGGYARSGDEAPGKGVPPDFSLFLGDYIRDLRFCIRSCISRLHPLQPIYISSVSSYCVASLLASLLLLSVNFFSYLIMISTFSLCVARRRGICSYKRTLSGSQLDLIEN